MMMLIWWFWWCFSTGIISTNIVKYIYPKLHHAMIWYYADLNVNKLIIHGSKILFHTLLILDRRPYCDTRYQGQNIQSMRIKKYQPYFSARINIACLFMYQDPQKSFHSICANHIAPKLQSHILGLTQVLGTSCLVKSCAKTIFDPLIKN